MDSSRRQPRFVINEHLVCFVTVINCSLLIAKRIPRFEALLALKTIDDFRKTGDNLVFRALFLDVFTRLCVFIQHSGEGSIRMMLADRSGWTSLKGQDGYKCHLSPCLPLCLWQSVIRVFVSLFFVFILFFFPLFLLSHSNLSLSSSLSLSLSLSRSSNIRCLEGVDVSTTVESNFWSVWAWFQQMKCFLNCLSSTVLLIRANGTFVIGPC